ncbi:phosphoglycerate kinase [Candidatus Pacearchaeota archaeon]|nr:phosphoglycerate kinase [Candidatus Pacearchaeota archaeon]
MKTLNDFDVKDKLILLRADINSDVSKGKIILSERIIEASKTILELKKKKAKIVILAHQGNSGKRDFVSLKQHAKLLSKYTRVKFIEDVCGEKAIRAIGKLRSGEVILLDNVRFVEDEFNPGKKNNVLLKNLSPLFDLYVNDAFSVCHRDHTSITGFPKNMDSCIGPLVEAELKALEKVSMKNCLYILGGAKPESNIKLLKGNKVLACGLFGQMCLVANGKDLGYQNRYLEDNVLVKGDYKKFKKKLKKKLKNVETPIDFAVIKDSSRKEFLLKDFPLEYEIEDIGEGTIKKYVEEIKKAKAIYMKGPAGSSSDERFAKGTVSLLKAIASSKGFSLVGGGHLSDTIEKYKLPKKRFGHVSLSGGALLNYIAGERLPGIEALR